MYRKRLLALGIPADLEGFEFLNCALELYKPRQKITGLYAQVAKIYNVSPQRVERNMRTAAEKTAERCTLGQFIAKYKILWNGETVNGNYSTYSEH